jgi:peptidyl-prolyl cis-trans isomerase D
MLHFVRRHARSWVVWVFVAIIIGVFTFWGVSAVVEGPSLQSAVALVDEHPIEQIDLQRAEMNLLEAYRNLYRERFTPEIKESLNLRQQALDGLIDRYLLIDRAKALGLEISDQQLLDGIVDNPSFQRDGRFDKELYLRILRSARQTPAEYEAGRRDDMLVQQMQALIADGVSVSDQEVRDDIVGQEERTKVAFVKFKASDETAKVELTEADAKAYYDANTARYAEPERIRIEYVAYPPDRFQEGLTIDDAAITEYYEANKEKSFTQPYEVRARHILRRVDEKADDATRQAARDLLEGLRKRIVDEGADFAKLAEEHSEDTGSKQSGGDLGFFAKGRMVEPFEKAALALQPGETSQVVETQFGFHLIQVQEIHEERVKPLEEVRGEIEGKLRTEKARERAGEAAKADHEVVAKGGDLAAAATARGLEVQKPDPRPRNAPFSGLGTSMPFSNALWQADAGALVEPTNVNGTWALAKVIEKLPAATQPFEQAKERVETELRRDKGTELARKAAEDFLGQVRQAGSLGSAAEAANREVQESGEIARSGRYVPGIGGSDELKLAIARLSDEKKLVDQVHVVAGDAFVVELLERTRPSDDEIGKKIAETRKSLLERKQQEVFTAYLEEQKAKGGIQVFPDRLEQLPKI